MSTATDPGVYQSMLGIPAEKLPESGPPDHYELLRLPRFEDDGAKIDAHYKKLNAHVRTYASGDLGTASQQVMNELAKAMLCLTDPERKRDYDESMGREFAEVADEYGRRPLDAILIEEGVASRDQMKEAEAFADARGLSLRDAVVQMKLTDAEKATRALAQHLRRPFVDLKAMPPEDAALDAVPRLTVKKHTILPLFEDNGSLIVACANEPRPELIEELEFRVGLPINPVLTTPRSIQQAIAQHYAPGVREEAVPLSGAQPVEAKKGKKDKKSKESKASGPSGERRRFSSLSDEEQAEKKKLGYIILLQAFSLPIVLPILLNMAGLIRPFPFTYSVMISVALLAAAAGYVTQVMWKWA